MYKLKFLITLNLLLAVTSNLVACPSLNKNATDLKVVRHSASAAYVLMIHGINNNLGIFDDLHSELLNAGYNLAFITLAGHSGCPEDKHTASSDLWLAQIEKGATTLRLQYGATKIFAIGYSLGGLVLVMAQNRIGRPLFEKQILLAPALSVRSYTRIVTWLSPFRTYNWSLPTLAPAEYLAYSDTSLNSYLELFKLLDEFEANPVDSVTQPETLVISHRDDPLVSTGGIKEVISKNKLTHWRLYERKDDLMWPHFNYHFVFSRAAFSEPAWKAQCKEILNLLQP